MSAADALAAIGAAYRDPDVIAQRLTAGGARVIRTIGSDAPDALLRAAGFTPVRVVPPSVDATPRADALIGKPTGRLRTHRLLEWLLEPSQADTPILITRADSQQPQLFAALRELRRLGEPGPRRFAMLDLLHQPRASSRRYNRHRLAQLGDWLVEQGGNPVSDASLSAGIDAETRLRTHILALQARRSAAKLSLSGTDMLRIAGACATLPIAEMIGHLEAIFADPAAPLKASRRLWLTGTAPEDDRVYAELERDGVIIVGDSHDWGVSRFRLAPSATLDDLADPERLAPLAARSLADAARTTIAAAREAAADTIVNLILDGDEVAPWLSSQLRGHTSFIVEEHVWPMPALPLTRPNAVAATRPERSRKLLRVAADFGTFQRAWFADVRAKVADGALFAVVNANAPQEILRAFDLPFVVNQWWASIVAAKRQSGRYRRLLAEHGLPADVEAYSTQALAAAFDDDPEAAPWGGLPTPDFVYAIAASDPTPAIFEAMAEHAHAAHFIYERTVDPRPAIATRWWEVMPDDWDVALEAERIDLLVDELRAVISQLETATGRAFDLPRFREILDLVNEQEDYYRATRDLIARTVPAPISIVDSMPATMVPQWHRGSAWARDAARAFHDEVAARVATGEGVVRDEKVRLMWVGRGLWSETSFYQRWEDSHGAVFVWSMYLALAADGYIRRFDRGRDPLRALAARFLTMGDELRMPSWAGPWHVHEAKTHQVDGAVALADADPFTVRALVDAGIPVLELGVDNFSLQADDLDRLNARVTSFIEGAAGARAAARRGIVA
ncbi:2-hydroxyacyl-CoA dehydratase family protein [Polymorphobacter megasporae]|uniref:2-hydroxyacyl-CoA dehydratase family protein n=1 Tax=Glacieibacterium megasporae TaxID=2835787 RepID=UPI001C1E8AE6|nr:2-hydroxyacyl-CoA dehydratase family protein [Polymorphobacter megasporae]UAJ11524.1 2-hydroxyacyl-CoA dehydratase family protein [Polymorphobacter megasporae]